MYTITQEPDNANESIRVKAKLNIFNEQQGMNPDMLLMAVFLRDELDEIVGGVYGELGLDWLYIDLLWIADSHKGKGHGRQLMDSIEHHAYQRGITQVHLATTTFQALPFYQHIGYQLFGEIADRPPNHQYHFLKRTITPMTTSPLPLTLNPEQAEIVTIVKGLRAHNLTQGIASKSTRVALFLRDQTNAVVGGLLGAIYWGWLDLQTFWIDESVRGQGYGTKLLNRAIEMSLDNNSPHIYTDVINAQNLGFFHHHGFQTFATLPDRPHGHITHLLRKDVIS